MRPTTYEPKEVKAILKTTANVIESCIDIVNERPTAYDIDETVEQLEKEKEYQKKNAIDKNFRIGVVNGLNAAIRIVKGGAE